MQIYLKATLIALALGVTTVFLIKVPSMLPAHGPKFQGVSAGQAYFRKNACTLMLVHNGQFYDPEGELAPLTAGQEYLLHTRCRKAGYLHLRSASSGGPISLNLPVGPWSESQALKTATGSALSIAVGAQQDAVDILYSFSDEPLPPEAASADTEGWRRLSLWTRALHFPVQVERL